MGSICDAAVLRPSRRVAPRLDTPQVPPNTNAAEADIREYVTRRKISGGTRHDDGRRARDTFTGLKKTCRSLPIRFGSTCRRAWWGMTMFLILPDVIQCTHKT